MCASPTDQLPAALSCYSRGSAKVTSLKASPQLPRKRTSPLRLMVLVIYSDLNTLPFKQIPMSDLCE